MEGSVGQPSDRLLADRWVHLTEANRSLPVPAGVAQGRPAAFCLNLDDLQDIPIPELLRASAPSAVSVEHELVLSLYDTRSKAFFGRQTTVARAAVERELLRAEALRKLVISDALYYHTTVDDESCVLVVQSVFIATLAGLETVEHPAGWALLPLFGEKAKAKAAEAEATPARFVEAPLYAGSAAALLLVDGVHPFADASLKALKRSGAATVAYGLGRQGALLGERGCAHLMAPNVLHSHARPLAGLLPPPAASAGPAAAARVRASFAPARLRETYALQFALDAISLPAHALKAATAAAGGAPAAARLSLALRLHNGHVPLGEPRALELETAADPADGARVLARPAAGAAAAVELSGAFFSPRLALVAELVVTAAPAAGVCGAAASVVICDLVLIPFNGAAVLCEGGLSLAMRTGPGRSHASGRPLAPLQAGALASRRLAGGAAALVELVCSVAPARPAALAERLPALLLAEAALRDEAAARAAGAKLAADARAREAAAAGAAAAPAAAASASGGGGGEATSAARLAVAELRQAFDERRRQEGEDSDTGGADFAAARAKASAMLRAYTGQHARVAFSALREVTAALRARTLASCVLVHVHALSVAEYLPAATGASHVFLDARIPSVARPVRSAVGALRAGQVEGARLREAVEVLEGTHAHRVLVGALAAGEAAALDVTFRLCTADAAHGGADVRGEGTVSLWRLLQRRRDLVDEPLDLVDARGNVAGTARVSVYALGALTRAAAAAAAATRPSDTLSHSAYARALGGNEVELAPRARGPPDGGEGFGPAAPVEAQLAARGYDARATLPRAERALIWQLLEEGAAQPGRAHPAAARPARAERFGADVQHEFLFHFTGFAQAVEALGADGRPARAARSIFLTVQFYNHELCTTPRALLASADGAPPDRAALLAAAAAAPSYDGVGGGLAAGAAVVGGVGYADPLMAAAAGQAAARPQQQSAADPLAALAGGGGKGAAADPLAALAGGGATAAAADPFAALVGGGGATAAAADPLAALSGGKSAAASSDPLAALSGGKSAAASFDPRAALAGGGTAAAAVSAEAARRERSDRLRGASAAAGAPPAAGGAARQPPPPSAAAASVVGEHAGMRAPSGERGAGLLWAFDTVRQREGVGLMVRFVVPPPALDAAAKAGERGSAEWRARAAARLCAYVEAHKLCIDVWDGDSLLQIGTAQVALATLLAAGASEHAGSAVTKAYLAADVVSVHALAAAPHAARPLAAVAATRGARPPGVVGTLQLMTARVATRLELPAEPAEVAPAGGRTASGAARAAAKGNSGGGGGGGGAPSRKVRTRALAEANGSAGSAAREALLAHGLADADAALRRVQARQARHARLGLSSSLHDDGAQPPPFAPRAQARPKAAAADPLAALAGGGAKAAAADPLAALAGGGAKGAAASSDLLAALARGGAPAAAAAAAPAAAASDPFAALVAPGAGAGGAADPRAQLAAQHRGPGSLGPASADPIAAAALAAAAPGAAARAATATAGGGAAGGLDAARAAAHARVAASEAALAALASARELAKHERISRLLRASSRGVQVLYPTYGSAEVFEVAFRNPYAVEHCFRIEVHDEVLAAEAAGARAGASGAHPSARELGLITDAAELRGHFARGRLARPAEEQLLLAASQLLLLPAEAVSLPFKFQSFRAARGTAAPAADGADAGAHVLRAPPSADERLAIAPRDIAVRICNAMGETVFELTVAVRPQPLVLAQTLRFHQPEGELLKARVRLGAHGGGVPLGADGPLDAHAHAATFWAADAHGAAGSGPARTKWVRCSDPDVLAGCDERADPLAAPTLYLKYRPAPAPALRRFLLALYDDEHLSALSEVWEVLVHSAQRIDVHAVVGERCSGRLLVRTPDGHGPATVEVFSSDEAILKFASAHPFDVLPGNPRELPFIVRPPLSTAAPRRDIVVHAVDTRTRALVGAYLVCVRCVVPAVSKTYDVTVQIGRPTSKKIALSNPYGQERLFKLHSSRPDLISLKDSELSVPVGEYRYMGLKFSSDPSLAPGVAEILVLVNNKDDKNEEAMLIRATFVPEDGIYRQPIAPTGRVTAELLD